MPKPPKPCLEHRCPRYAEPGKSRCSEHQAEALKKRDLSPGTDHA
jgi:hypothetical protein